MLLQGQQHRSWSGFPGRAGTLGSPACVGTSGWHWSPVTLGAVWTTVKVGCQEKHKSPRKKKYSTAHVYHSSTKIGFRIGFTVSAHIWRKKKQGHAIAKIAFLQVTLPRADGTACQRDQEKGVASNRHPLNHDSSNAGVIRSEKTVKECLGVKRTYNSWSGCQLFLPPGQMSDLGASR